MTAQAAPTPAEALDERPPEGEEKEEGVPDMLGVAVWFAGSAGAAALEGVNEVAVEDKIDGLSVAGEVVTDSVCDAVGLLCEVVGVG